MNLVSIIARFWPWRRPVRSRVEHAVHVRLLARAKAQRIPLRPFSFESMAKLRERRDAGLADEWLIDVPTGDTMREYLSRCFDEWAVRHAIAKTDAGQNN